MKKPLLISAALILCTTLMAQVPQGISHQAVIRNTQGELVTGQTIGVRVSILQGSAEGVAVFVETHQPLSNENGLITYVIGEGTPTLGFLDDIDWTSGPYFLKTEADPAGGSNYTITGTTQFLSVPYALHAGTSEDNHWEYSETNIFTRNTGNVGIGTQTPFSLLHTLGNGTGEGNVLFEGLYKTPANQGDPPVTGPGTRMMWYPDKAAFRVGRVLDDEWDKNNIGVYSIAMGYNTKATGMGSVALGYEANATSDYAISLGFETNTAFPRSVAIGNNTRAGSPFEIVVGRYNTPYIPSSFFGWHSNDRLFVIGNGTSQENRSNAVTVLKSGNFGIGTSTPEAQFHTTGSVRFAGAGTPGTGKVLTSNEDGTATWQEFTNSSNWTVSGSGIYRLEGNVGIGVENPEGKLHVSAPGEWLGVSFSGTGLDDLVVDISGYNGTGPTAYAVRILNTGPDPNHIVISNNGGTTWSGSIPIAPDIDMGYGVIINFGSTSGYTYNDRWDWTVNESFEDVLLVKDDRVGIGTTNPSQTLDVNGNIQLSGGDRSLGTWSANSLDLTTDSSTRMTITSAGNIGIGTSSPGELLDVNGNIRLSGSNPSLGTWSANNLDLTTNSTTRMTITSAGNIGIGTSTPGQLLDVNGNIRLSGGNRSLGTWSANNLSLTTYSSPRMTITSAGNVGIGTISPTALLHTHGTGTGGGNVLFVGSLELMGPGDPPAQEAGTRMMWYPDKAAFRAGHVEGMHWHKDSIGNYSFATGRNTVAKGVSSTAMGGSTTASGYASTAMGFVTSASGDYSTAMGWNTYATGLNSFAIGILSTASGDYSTAMGWNTYATGDYSTAMGRNTFASGDYSTAMGSYARAIGLYSFAIHLNDAYGFQVPANRFQISGASAIGGNTAWTNWSDKRMKKDVQFLENENSLEKIMKLQGVRFSWKESNADVADRYYLGFLAQDVFEVLPEPVLYDELNDIYSMEYTAIIPVLVEGIKEQQAIIELQQCLIEELLKRVEKLEAEK